MAFIRHSLTYLTLTALSCEKVFIITEYFLVYTALFHRIKTQFTLKKLITEMTPASQVIGHPVRFGKGLAGLFKQAWWDIPEVMSASFMGLLGMGMATIGVYNYIQNQGENREYKAVYYVVRQGDPRACKLKNPALSEYTC